MAEVIYSDRDQICGCEGQGGETEGIGYRELFGGNGNVSYPDLHCAYRCIDLPKLIKMCT